MTIARHRINGGVPEAVLDRGIYDSYHLVQKSALDRRIWWSMRVRTTLAPCHRRHSFSCRLYHFLGNIDDLKHTLAHSSIVLRSSRSSRSAIWYIFWGSKGFLVFRVKSVKSVTRATSECRRINFGKSCNVEDDGGG